MAHPGASPGAAAPQTKRGALKERGGASRPGETRLLSYERAPFAPPRSRTAPYAALVARSA